MCGDGVGNILKETRILDKFAVRATASNKC